MARFGGFESLAEASVADVIRAWQGLGYNRRALRLLEGAQRVTREFDGRLPREIEVLRSLPGIGSNTAASIFVFAYDLPAVFIETNIRRAFIDEFFHDAQQVPDSRLLPLIAASVERDRPREWYWALMDYGANLAKRGPNPNQRSKHYVVQSTFQGSLRQLRGEVLRQLLVGAKSRSELLEHDSRMEAVLAALESEGFIVETSGAYALRR
jgi:A/G-specific adenine glycosylase